MNSPANSKTPAVLDVFNTLFSFFGPQGWWPTTSQGSILPQYHKLRYDRLSEKNRFEICVGAILTQNTAWTNVEKAIANLNRSKIFDIDKLSRIKPGNLAKLIRPSGYYNQKAKRLKVFARYFAREHNGSFKKFFSGDITAIRKELLDINGIGPETADSMLLYAGDKKTFVVDAYTCRLGERMGWFAGKKYDLAKNYFQENLPDSLEIYNEFHALIVALGKNICRKKPLCGKCPLSVDCLKNKVCHGT